MTPWYDFAAWFLGGALLANAIPHTVSGLTGRAFQTPFAKPPGQGLSSATVNILWGAFNLVVAYALLCHVGAFDMHDLKDAATVCLGALLLALPTGHHFGKFHGGNLKD